MKKMICVLATALLFLGCGSRQQVSDKDVSAVPGKKDYISQGIRYLQKSNPRDAIRSFDAAIQQNPTDEKPYIVLGETYMRMSRYDKAIDTFSAATRVAPTDGHLYYLLAVSQGLSGNMEEAKINAEKSLILFKRDNDAQGLQKSAVLLKGIMQAK